MTVLVDYEIRKYIENGIIGVDPYNPELINPNSLDLRLAYEFMKYDSSSNPYTIDPFDEISINPDIECDKIEKIGFYDFILGSTIERIKLPNFICAQVNGKSSLSRLGLQIHQTGGFIDCGFEGNITLEMFNCNTKSIKLYPQMQIAQIVFYKTMPAESDYGQRKSSKYQNQTGPTPSKYYLNKPVE